MQQTPKTSVPALSAEQRAEALAKASEARRERSAMLKSVGAGETSVCEVLDSDRPVCKRTRVRSLLMALPGVGAVRADKFMEQNGISASRRVQGLGSRQREAVLAFANER